MEDGVSPVQPGGDARPPLALLSLGARKLDQRGDLSRIGGSQSVQIFLPCFPGLYQAKPAPGKDRPSQLNRDDISNQSGMSAISIGKEVDEDKAVMKPDSDLVSGVSLVFYPIPGISRAMLTSISRICGTGTPMVFSVLR